MTVTFRQRKTHDTMKRSVGNEFVDVAKCDGERMMSAACARTRVAEMTCEMAEAIELKARAQMKVGRLQTYKQKTDDR
jgi:hypothetical protein